MNTWKMDKLYEKKAKASISSDPQALKKWDSYVSTVIDNPFYNSKHRRIAKLKGPNYKGLYRYKREPLRVVYRPNKSSRTIFTLEAGTATKIGYKKKSNK